MAAASSCSTAFNGDAIVEDEFQTPITPVKTVTFGMEASFYSMAETRAEAVPTQLLVLDVLPDKTISVYTRGVAEATDVGGGILDNLTLEMKYGTHKLYFVAADKPFSNYDEPSLTVSWIASEGNVLNNCWAASMDITVGEETAGIQSVVMPIRVASIQIVTSDIVTPETSEMSTTLSNGSWQISLETMKGCKATGIYRDIVIPESYKGKKSVSLALYTFLPEGESNGGTLTVAAKTSSGSVINSHTMTDVPIREAQITRYTGMFYNKYNGFSRTSKTLGL